jgi:carbon storage regulator CsrA
LAGRLPPLQAARQGTNRRFACTLFASNVTVWMVHPCAIQITVYTYTSIKNRKEVIMGTLVLSRREGESINIGSDVVVKIQRVQGRSAKVLIFAPDDIEILRTELAPPIYDHADLSKPGTN